MKTVGPETDPRILDFARRLLLGPSMIRPEPRQTKQAGKRNKTYQSKVKANKAGRKTR